MMFSMAWIIFLLFLCILNGRREMRYILKNSRNRRRYVCYYGLTLITAWWIGLIDPILYEETPETLSFIEGVAYKAPLGKGGFSLKVKPHEKTSEMTPSFTFDLVSEASLVPLVGKNVKIWYRKNGFLMGGKGYVYQICENGEMIYGIDKANKKVKHFNRTQVPLTLAWISTWWLTICIGLRKIKVNMRWERIKTSVHA